MMYLTYSQFVCVFYVNASHSVCECHGEKNIATYKYLYL